MLLKTMTSLFLDGLQAAGEQFTTREIAKFRAAAEPDRSMIEDALWDGYQHVARLAQRPALYEYHRKKRPRDSDFWRATKAICVQLNELADFSPYNAVGQWVCQVKDGRVHTVSMQPRPYGSMNYDEYGLTIDGSIDWMRTRYPAEYPEVRAHTLNLYALDYLAPVLINANEAPRDGTLTVQTARISGPRMRVVYRPLQANHPVLRLNFPE